MQYKFNKHIESLFPDIRQRKGISVIMAVSGGADSMVMGELLRNCPYVCRLAVAHCNFHLRAEESDGDERYVEDWARANGIELFVKHFDTEEYAASNGISIEMAARELRYAWFEELRSANGFDYISVAHNLNDNVETLFLNLLRGTGIRGLAGMKEINNGILRPLMIFTREQIEDFARANGLVFRTDSTNLSNEYKRNRIRNEIFPLMKQINPSFLRTMARNIRYFSEISDLADMAADKVCREAVVDGNPVRVDYGALMDSGAPSYMIFTVLERFGFNPATSEKVMACLSSDEDVTRSGSIFLSESHLALVDRDRLLVYDLDDVPECLGGRMKSGVVDITVGELPVELSFGGRRYGLRLVPAADADFASGRLYADVDKVSFPLSVRNWGRADRMRPFGMKKGSRKISDIFSDARYDVVKKNQVPVFADASGTIVALDNIKVSEMCRLDSGSVTALEISLSE